MITIKEEFLTCDKLRRAIKLGGYEVVLMWLAMKGYAAQHPTDGFVPDEDIDELPGAPKNPRKSLKALVECGRLERDGGRGAGLVDPENHGWQLHDYLDHARSAAEEEERKRKAREKKAKWRAKGGGQNGGQDGGRSPGHVEGHDGDEKEVHHGGPRVRARPQPSPAPKIQPDDDYQDLTGHSAGGQGSSSDSERETTIPLDFELHPAAVVELARRTSFPTAVIRAAAKEFRDYWVLGQGMGKARSGWQGRCRADILEKHKLGKLQEIAARLDAESGQSGEDPSAAALGQERLERLEAQAKAQHEAAAREQAATGPVGGRATIRAMAEGIGG